MNRWIPFLALFFLVLTLAACDEDDCQTCLDPDPPAPSPTLDNVWPNEDGRQWNYEFAAISWRDMTTAPTDSFSIDDVDSLLAIAPGAPAGLVPGGGIWRLQFTGTTTTDSGAEGQLLAGTFFVDGQPVRREVAVDRASLVQRLVLPQRLTAAALLARRVQGPGGLFLSGDTAFVKTAELIGSFGDLNQEVAWKYLEANLEVGHTFSLQLVPDLSDDVFLFGRVRAVRDLETPYGTFPNTVSVNYLIDQGEQVLTDESGTELGRTRAYIIGRMEYAPEVGPVFSVERSVLPEVDGVPESGFAFEYVHDLIGSGLLED